MASLDDPGVRLLLEEQVDHAGTSTHDESNPYDDVAVRGAVTATTDGADAHTDRPAKTCLGVDSDPIRQPGEQRVGVLLAPARVRHRKQR